MKTIIFFAANPLNTSRLRLDQEFRDIKEALKLSIKRNEFSLHHVWATRIDDLRRGLLEIEAQIVHFSGHGTGEEGIVLEDQTGQAKLVPAEALTSFFELFPSVECVLLNACYSDFQARAIAQNVKYVVGMKQSIGDEAAINFAVSFYDALGAGKSIEFAYKIGCSSLKMFNLPDAAIPSLWIKNDNFVASDQINEATAETARITINDEALQQELPKQLQISSPENLVDYHPGKNVNVYSLYSKEDILSFQDRRVSFAVSFERVLPVDSVTCDFNSLNYFLPTELESQIDSFLNIFRASLKKSPFNDIMARLDGVSFSNDSLTLVLRPSNYFRHIASNYFCDIVITSSGRTVRSYLEPGPELNSFSKTRMSNHIGLNCALITQDKYLVTPKKSSDVVYDPNQLEISVSAGFKWSPHNISLLVWDEYYRVISDELGVTHDQVTNIYFLALLRDLRKGGKPELFSIAHTTNTLADLQYIHKTKASRNHWEFQSIEGISVREPYQAIGNILSNRIASPNLMAFCLLYLRNPDKIKLD